METGITELVIVIIVGVLSGFALYMGNTEMASLGMGGLVGYLSQNLIPRESGI